MGRNFLAGLVAVGWALWLGGLFTTFIFVTRLFKQDPAIFHSTAPILFHVLQQYQLLLAAILLPAVFIWRLWLKKISLTVLFCLFALAAFGNFLNTAFITPHMDQISQAGGAGSAQFMAWHGRSMMVYLAETAILLIAGWVLPLAMVRKVDIRQ